MKPLKVGDKVMAVKESKYDYFAQFDTQPNTITFQTSDTSEPILVLKPNGDIYVNGRLTTNDMEVVEGLRIFLEQAEYQPSHLEQLKAKHPNLTHDEQIELIDLLLTQNTNNL